MDNKKYAPGMEYRNNKPDIQERDKLECNNYRGITLLTFRLPN